MSRRAAVEDPYDAEHVVGLDGPLQVFNDAGVLLAADVHTARRLGRLSGTDDDLAVLAAAFAVRATRYGHVFADLASLPEQVTDVDGHAVDLPAEAWPDPEAWLRALAASPLVSHGTPPLRLVGHRVYLDRYHAHETRVTEALVDRADGGPPALQLSPEGEEELVARLGGNDRQLAAARAALHTRLAVIAGGPGTGKTATIAELIGVASRHATTSRGPARIAVAAPTGKAAARLGEEVRQRLGPATGIVPTTVHRLLGGTRARTRFRHHADNHLPYDLVVVDEVSMVALAMLARLLEAMAPEATLLLVGDPDQLESVEAGTVLGDILEAADHSRLASQVATLRTNYRSGQVISDLADRVRAGDADGALDLMAINPGSLEEAPVSLLVPDRPGGWPHDTGTFAPLRSLLEPRARRAMTLAADGDVAGALAETMAAKVLCAHRRGPDGVRAWNATIEGWSHDLPSYRRPTWYPGRPLMIRRNDYELEVFNGDIGVVVDDGETLRVVIDGRSGRPIEHRRLGEVQTVHAMTVHKSQGSQFDDVVVVLPTEPSPILTRQLLYTAVTRARHRVVVVATRQVLHDTIQRRITRASALAERLAAAL